MSWTCSSHLVVNSLIPLSISACLVEFFSLPSLPRASGMLCHHLGITVMPAEPSAARNFIRLPPLVAMYLHFGAWEFRNPSLPLVSITHLIVNVTFVKLFVIIHT